MLGRTISHYRIEEELGRGGMGVVYRARDHKLHRSVALKMLTGDFGNRAEHRALVLAEARAACALNHPGITTIYEVVEDGDQLFIVMELVCGKNLRVLTVERPLEIQTAVRLSSQVAEALAAAHAHGVIHGDIKPENIVVLADGRTKLLDFGIARRLPTATLEETSTGPLPPADSAWKGTLPYMAPEQLAGESPTASSDLYSLGVVLYEIISGQRPFAAPTVPVLIAQILNQPAPRLDSRITDLPGEAARIVQKLLEKQAEIRYQSANELRTDLVALQRELELGGALPATVKGKRAVAVLPFRLLSPNAEDEFLSVALADAVINELSRSEQLVVRPTSTVMRYNKAIIDALSAARELNVDVVVEGSIQKFGQKLRLYVQAWNVRDGSTLLSAKHESEMVDLFGLQDTIAGSLARTLGIKSDTPTPAEPERPTTSAMAYELLLRASERLTRQNRWDTRTAIEMLLNAVDLDPQFADAWARLAQAYWIMGVSFEPGPKWIHAAEKAIRRALQVDPNNAYAHCSRGLVVWSAVKGYQNAAALRALRTALRLNPGCHPARAWQGCILLHVGLMEESEEQLKTALAANPEDAFTLAFLGQRAACVGDYAAATEYHNRGLHIDRANLWANLFYPTAPLYGNDLAKAEESIRVARQIVQDPLLTACEALLWAKRGEARKSLALCQRALKSKKMLAHTHHAWHTVAAAYALLGKSTQAITLLQKCVDNGLPSYTTFLCDPHLHVLKNQTPFLRLMANLKKEHARYRKEFGRK
jgi:non-specific serine/threonine protein kinase